jgi:hypothetical protein
MVTVVVIINVLISLILLVIAWQMWRLKYKVAYIAGRLNAYERAIYAVLHSAPEKISRGQQGISRLSERQERLALQIQQWQQLLSLLVVGRRIWRRYFRR